MAAKKIGRPSKFTVEARKGIIVALKSGIGIKHAAGMVGVSESTAHEWLRRGKRSADGKAEKGDRQYEDFYLGCMRSIGGFIGQHALQAHKLSMSGDSRMTQFILQTRGGEDWAPAQRMEHSTPEGRPFEVADATNPKDELQSKLRDIRDRVVANLTAAQSSAVFGAADSPGSKRGEGPPR